MSDPRPEAIERARALAAGIVSGEELREGPSQSYDVAVLQAAERVSDALLTPAQDDSAGTTSSFLDWLTADESLTTEEKNAVARFLEGWHVSGVETTREVMGAAKALAGGPEAVNESYPTDAKAISSSRSGSSTRCVSERSTDLRASGHSPG